MTSPSQKHKETTQSLRALRRRIGTNIHAQRVKQEMKLHKLSALCKMSPAQIDMLELGKGNIDLVQIVRIAAALNVEADALLGTAKT